MIWFSEFGRRLGHHRQHGKQGGVGGRGLLLKLLIAVFVVLLICTLSLLFSATITATNGSNAPSEVRYTYFPFLKYSFFILLLRKLVYISFMQFRIFIFIFHCDLISELLECCCFFFFFFLRTLRNFIWRICFQYWFRQNVSVWNCKY